MSEDIRVGDRFDLPTVKVTGGPNQYGDYTVEVPLANHPAAPTVQVLLDARILTAATRLTPAPDKEA